MSIQLNHSDFQCLQDQLVDLKTKNYELAEKHRRGQADFEAAKAKICSLQLKLEEQERDFQVTSSTLRREIELAYNSNRDKITDLEDSDDGDYRAKYKKLLHKAKELQQRYEKSLEVIKQMDEQIATLTSKSVVLEEERDKLKQTIDDNQSFITTSEEQYRSRIAAAIEEYRKDASYNCQEHIDSLNAIRVERDNLNQEVQQMREEVMQYKVKIECEAEERRMHDRKGAQMIKELKRQLALEKNRNETIQKRLESLLRQPTVVAAGETGQSDLENRTRLSTSSSNTNGNSRGSQSLGNGQQRDDDNSVSSWSLVPGKTTSTSSICSTNSEDRGTVHLPTNSERCDTLSSQQQATTSSRHDWTVASNPTPKSPNKHKPSLISQFSIDDTNNFFAINKSMNSTQLNCSTATDSNQPSLKYEDQAALMERITRLQHDKWSLEEKLSYMEQANATLAQGLADKSYIIRHYFMEQAVKSTSIQQHDLTTPRDPESRRVSFPSNILSEKPSFKKMVDFLRERGQIVGGESESIAREATKKMQVMLEETLIKCLRLQENLDYVTSELNKYQS